MKFIICFLVIIFLCCNKQEKNPNAFSVKIKGNKSQPGDTFFLAYYKFFNGERQEVIDTVIYHKNDITFTGEIAEPTEAHVSTMITEKIDTVAKLKMLRNFGSPDELKEDFEAYYLNPRKRQFFSFFLLPGKTTIEAPLSIMSKAKGSDELKQYLELKTEFERRKFKRDLFLKYAQKNPESLISLYALQQSLHPKIEDTREYFDAFNSLSPTIRSWESAKLFLKQRRYR